ncbi:MAG: hypothetical protein JO076_03580 [Verrucomicrobia bacterium]|nr:hypothetical protein [Verrucomicrobiota bacterium]
MQLSYRIRDGGEQEPEDLSSADETTLRYEVVQGDIILEHANVDLSAKWSWIPLIDFTAALQQIVRQLTATETLRKFEFTESDAVLEFRKQGNDVVITASYAPGAIKVPFSQFQQQVERFTTQFTMDIYELYPELSRNPAFLRLGFPSS